MDVVWDLKAEIVKRKAYECQIRGAGKHAASRHVGLERTEQLTAEPNCSNRGTRGATPLRALLILG